ncbi:MAG: hypothetical protein EAZ92_04375 [Candidatus Kapaibacterium sp.]|nr:MAG: hypothetical protein EAZ92_04375 [Candidatus Kapabacteria bacterium]
MKSVNGTLSQIRLFVVMAMLALGALAIPHQVLLAQDAPKIAPPTFSFSAYVDTYFAFDNDATEIAGAPSGARQFSYLGYVKNQFSLNTAQITGSLTSDDYRAFVTLHYGDLRRSAYDGLTRFNALQQANAGFRLVDKIWIDAGLFYTHIGGEGLLPRDNWFTLYALATNNEPFYQAGVRASYESSTFQAQLHLLNGYGVFEDNNADKSLGWFIGFTPSSVISASISGLLGNEQATGTAAATRIYNNAVVTVTPFEPLSIKGQVDLGLESGKTYLAGFGAVKYMITPKLSVAARYEFINNPGAIITSEIAGGGFGASVEFRPIPTSYIRAEMRSLQFDSKYTPFLDASKRATSSRLEGVLTLGFWL